ncbi:MAG: hypothetical protein HYY43_06160 [Deltaproteobacteria bacterium]|nr:hypothetical protein [Deltaproteobacteria bacterium]
MLITACGSSSSSTTSNPKVQTTGSGSDTDVADSVSAMEVGDLYYVTFDSTGAASIDFNGDSSSAGYKLIVQSTNSLSSSVQIASANISKNTAQDFDSFLRQSEVNLAENLAPANPPKTSLLSKSISKAVGDTASFKVLSSIVSTTSYTTVTGAARCVEDHVIVYVDEDVSADNLSDADIETLCSQFEYAAAIEEQTFGSPSDVNGDGHVVTLITPAVNALGASGGGIITGYFYATDLFASSGSNPTSNEMEIIYILAPDPEGDYGTAITKEFAMSNLMPAVVPHELQHAISYNQHVFINDSSSEDDWLNEALSHFAEDFVGFGQENPSRIEVYFEETESVSLAPGSSPDLAERGAEYLFIKYLYERVSDQNAFLASLVNTTNTGKDNIVAAFGGADSGFDEWGEFMRRWAIAMALTDTGISSTAQYQFNSPVWNSTTSHWQGICLICDTEDGRGTILYGPNITELAGSSLNLSLAGTATAFYSISSPPSTISLSGNSSAGLQGALIRTE